MSHTTIYFLTEAESYDDAEAKVTAYLEIERFFDSFEVLPKPSGSLAQKSNELEKFIKDWDWKKNADEFLNLAEGQKTNGDLESYGYCLINAGQLYAQHLTVDTYAFNIDTSDYSIPKEDRNWWVIAIDFHY